MASFHSINYKKTDKKSVNPVLTNGMLAFFILVFLLLFKSSVHAQHRVKYVSSEHIFSVNLGYSPNSVKILGKTPSSITNIIQFGYQNKILRNLGSHTLYYKIIYTPYINFNYPKRDNANKMDEVSGFGFSPFGIATFKTINDQFGFGFSSNGGFILLEKNFPTNKARRLNYTMSLSSDIVYKLNELLSLSLSYKFHHISNAQTGIENPGLDSNFIQFSILISK